jgi:BirA family biotin operon repressor/biotin-[acetyl-CoA-carboxylase] ligase
LPDFFTLHRFESVESTNDTAKQLAMDGAPEGTLIISAEQKGGRGRSGRLWTSPPGNLYLSLLLKPQVPLSAAAQVSFVAALSVYDLLADLVAQERLRLKWPNDVLVDDRKVCGILLESATKPENGLAWLIVGIGLNIASVPSVVARTATCLHDLGRKEVDVEYCLVGLSAKLWHWLDCWRNQGFAPVRTAWLERSQSSGLMLTVRTGRECFEAAFEDLDDDGALIVKLPEGGIRRITAGEVFFSGQGSG